MSNFILLRTLHQFLSFLLFLNGQLFLLMQATCIRVQIFILQTITTVLYLYNNYLYTNNVQRKTVIFKIKVLMMDPEWTHYLVPKIRDVMLLQLPEDYEVVHNRYHGAYSIFLAGIEVVMFKFYDGRTIARSFDENGSACNYHGPWGNDITEFKISGMDLSVGEFINHPVCRCTDDQKIELLMRYS